ncbi:raffinose/stachyose/melibiose transport system substrate-binding protein [Paenibacillus anaericanus]|uniref:ABC transporter substrate-binding protein n=1 Tax=Paenibacillus anaericanus TaxID=170367 RepID=UPI00277EBCC3|nr:extracellular solute-binding protein [Paenibacillus anaericanus]MDQ0089501.1 raffinose/stachyose/melibiose transport system substrate-binding protein [Paenibacillus anaericanus]
MKKAMAILLTAILLISVVSGCGKSESKKTANSDNKPAANSAEKDGKKVKVRLMAYNQESIRKSYLEFLKQELPNIEVEFQFVALDQFNSVLNTQLASKEGPDLIETGGETTLLASAGYLLDLTDQDFISNYTDTGFQAYTLKDKIYATPLQSWFEGIYYNKGIFKENGLTPPQTFDEWMQIHQTLKDKGIKPQSMGASSWEPMMKQSMGMILNEFYSKQENKGFDDKFNASEVLLADNWSEALTEWHKIIEQGYIDSKMLGMDYDQALDEFATGKSAMWQSGPWALETIKQKNPNLELGMFPFPGTEKGTGWMIGGPGSALAINKDSKNVEAALEVLRVTATPEAQKALIADNVGSSFVKGVEVDLGEEFADSSAAFEAGNVYGPWLYWLGGNPIVESYGKALQEVLSGSKTTDEALKDADKTAKTIRDSM